MKNLYQYRLGRQAQRVRLFVGRMQFHLIRYTAAVCEESSEHIPNPRPLKKH